MRFIPEGYTPIEAYENGEEIIILGTPEDESHNCDDMGCGTCHITYRIYKPLFTTENLTKLLELVTEANKHPEG